MCNIDYTEIDENMRRLVLVLNKFDHLDTVGSRGGHTEEEMGRCGYCRRYWHVSFTLDPTPKGWEALKFVTDVVRHYLREELDEEDMISLELVPDVWHTFAYPLHFRMELYFNIWGFEKTDPNKLADYLEAYLSPDYLESYLRYDDEALKWLYDGEYDQLKRIGLAPGVATEVLRTMILVRNGGQAQ